MAYISSHAYSEAFSSSFTMLSTNSTKTSIKDMTGWVVLLYFMTHYFIPYTALYHIDTDVKLP
jgi:hypothetical protein